MTSLIGQNLPKAFPRHLSAFSLGRSKLHMALSVGTLICFCAAGVTVLMSWASAARTTGYVYDLNSAFVARRKLPEVAEILQLTNAKTINIFAHSMGTLLTMEGIVNASQTGRLKNVNRVDNILLASPDIDIDLFRTQMEVIPQIVKNKIFILTSDDDSALKASRRVAGGVPRVGLADAEALEKEFGVVVIDLSEIENSGSGSHSKFTGSPEVVQLIGLGLNSTDQFGQSAAPPIERVTGVFELSPNDFCQ